MEGVDDQSRTPSGGDSDFQRRVELYALEGQLRRSKNSQLTFDQLTNRLVDGWWFYGENGFGFIEVPGEQLG
jgi:hypothetical protein